MKTMPYSTGFYIEKCRYYSRPREGVTIVRNRDELSAEIDVAHDALMSRIRCIDKGEAAIILQNLHRNHTIFVEWIELNLHGKNTPFPRVQIESAFQDVPLPMDEAQEMFEESHSDITTILCGFTDESLFTKGLYEWLGNSDLASYFQFVTIDAYETIIKIM